MNIKFLLVNKIVTLPGNGKSSEDNKRLAAMVGIKENFLTLVPIPRLIPNTKAKKTNISLMPRKRIERKN